MAQLVAKRYGTALFELAVEQEKIGIMEEELQGLQGIVESEKDFMEILTHPKITTEEKIGFLKRLFKSNISQEIIGLMVLLVQKNRQEYLLDIIQVFVEKLQEYQGKTTAHITTAVPLSEEQKVSIQKRLKEMVHKEIIVEAKVDKRIIGGLVIRIGDQIIDNSIQSQLKKLSGELKQIQLA